MVWKYFLRKYFKSISRELFDAEFNYLLQSFNRFFFYIFNFMREMMNNLVMREQCVRNIEEELN